MKKLRWKPWEYEFEQGSVTSIRRNSVGKSGIRVSLVYQKEGFHDDFYEGSYTIPAMWKWSVVGLCPFNTSMGISSLMGRELKLKDAQREVLMAAQYAWERRQSTKRRPKSGTGR